MLDRSLKFEKVFRIFGIILRLLVVVTGKFFDAFEAVPLRHGPEMTNINLRLVAIPQRSDSLRQICNP
jgi:hypothetical protein